MRGFGRVFRRRGSRAYWLAYYVRGKEVRESSGTDERPKAERLLKRRLGEVHAGTFVEPAQDRLLFSELLEALETDYKLNGRKSAATLKYRLRRVRAEFGADRALDVTEARLEGYKTDRLDEGMKPATVNRELAAIGRAFRLAHRQHRVSNIPHIDFLKERNVRRGFFEEHELAAVLAELPEHLRPLVRFAAMTGWRKGEVTALRWIDINFKTGTVRLEPGTTKNEEGREFPFGAMPELAALLREQLQLTREEEHRRGQVIPWVFHGHGRRLVKFSHSWNKACEAAKLAGRLFHDLRRTAVRNLELAGVPRSMAMKLTGHLTETVYRRYAIASQGDLKAAVKRLAEFRSGG